MSLGNKSGLANESQKARYLNGIIKHVCGIISHEWSRLDQYEISILYFGDNFESWVMACLGNELDNFYNWQK